MSQSLSVKQLRERLAILQERMLGDEPGSPAYISASMHIEKLEEEIRVSLSRPLIGTVYLDAATGNTYRLTGYYTVFNYETEERSSEQPGYMRYTTGGAGSESVLPAGAFAIWVPIID
jgi:hypothetical protein